MDLNIFDYHLPKERIAQEPVYPRDLSRMLFLPKKEGAIKHTSFRQLPSFLKKGDLLVFNNTRVIPARLLGFKEHTGGKVECFLLHQKDHETWTCLLKPGRRLPTDTPLVFAQGKLRGRVGEALDDGVKEIHFNWEGDFWSLLNEIGHIPLPPYIHELLKDPERYQTIYGKYPGSVAAPTAGLHFTPEVLKAIQEKGIESVEVLLHVGLGTFRPVETDNITNHKMHQEYFEISQEAAEKINTAKANGGRIIAVGTTSVRTIESMTQDSLVKAGKGWTDIFIYPGYQFKILDGLLTNFHLPKSTLLMLVSALAGRERVLDAYKTAVEQQYRFFSFGDAMLIL